MGAQRTTVKYNPVTCGHHVCVARHGESRSCGRTSRDEGPQTLVRRGEGVSTGCTVVCLHPRKEMVGRRETVRTTICEVYPTSPKGLQGVLEVERYSLRGRDRGLPQTLYTVDVRRPEGPRYSLPPTTLSTPDLSSEVGTVSTGP